MNVISKEQNPDFLSNICTVYVHTHMTKKVECVEMYYYKFINILNIQKVYCIQLQAKNIIIHVTNR